MTPAVQVVMPGNTLRIVVVRRTSYRRSSGLTHHLTLGRQTSKSSA
jgi:hypothetical protein